MEELNVSLPEMRAAVVRLQDLATMTNRELCRLQGRVDSVMGSSWRGAAGKGAAQAFEEWNDGAREVMLGWDHLIHAVRTAADEYGGTDEGNASGFSGLTFGH